MPEIKRWKLEDKFLLFSPYAWAKLQFLCHIGNTEVGGFGQTSPDDPLLVTDFHLINQESTPSRVEFSDDGMADYHLKMNNEGIPMEQCGRIWIHTHPTGSANPSHTDEDSWKEKFKDVDSICMFILSRSGEVYCRVRVRHGILGNIEFEIRHAVDWDADFEASDAVAWKAEYDAKVTEYKYTNYKSSAPKEDHRMGFQGGIPSRVHEIGASQKNSPYTGSTTTTQLTSETTEGLWRQAHKEQEQKDEEYFGRQDKNELDFLDAAKTGLYDINTGWVCCNESLKWLVTLYDLEDYDNNLLVSDDEDLVEWWAGKRNYQIPPRNTTKWGDLWETFWRLLSGDGTKVYVKNHKNGKIKKKDLVIPN